MTITSTAEVVDAVYALVVISGAKNVQNGVCGALASESGWRTVSDDEVEEECCATVETGEVIGGFWGWVR